MKQSILKSALTTALGLTALTSNSIASASVVTADWTGYFQVLVADGNGFANTSISSKQNQFVTPISGTLSIDNVTGLGTATIADFEFCSNSPSGPAQFTGISLEAIGNGVGGPGSLMLGNMLFNWNGTFGIPVSVVLDAAGFLAGEYAPGGANSAVAAADGTYVGTVPGGTYVDANGYLDLGPMPMVTTAWNTTRPSGCISDDCMNFNPSGLLPLVYDVTPNLGYDNLANTGGSIGGNPMADGPFQGSNINFQIANLTNVVIDGSCNNLPNLESCPPPEVPIPAAAWLFGSGLIGLLGMARKRKPTL